MPTSARTSSTVDQVPVFYHHPAPDCNSRMWASALQSLRRQRNAQAGVETSSSSGRTFRCSAFPLADNSKAGPVTTAAAT